LNRGSRGLLIDPTNGQADLVNRELRTINTYALFDDPSRLFRLIRFQYVLGFEVAARTQSQIENALVGEYQMAAPVSALATEIRALSESENAVAALEAFDRLGLLNLLSPALTGAKLNASGLAKFEKLAHTVLPPGTKSGWLAFLAVLMEKMSPRETADLLRHFDLPKKETDSLKKLESQAKKLESALKSARITKPSHVYDALKDATPDEVLMVLYDSVQRVVQDRIRAYYQKYLPLAQEVTEEQVAATGVKPGTPKFEKAFQNMVTTHLNARPKKVVPVEPEVVPVPAPPIARSAVRK
jgi:tRNA nucleotidyltransferase/poly(A) polymerase